MNSMPATTIPRATARLQLHKNFTLDDAAGVVPYLAALGISHVYTSPILTARPGSMHGYDIVDHRAINPELGGEPALHRLVGQLRARGMGLIVDIVPNHMGVGGADNAWWLDVLEWGRSSPYAEFFDIDWEPPDPRLHNRVLAPFLGAPYGACLEAGEIALNFDPASGRLAATYGEHYFPIFPRHYATVFGTLAGDMLTLGAGADARAGSRAGSRNAAAAMRARLRDLAANPAGKAQIDEALAKYNSSTPDGRQRLHALLERQHYRLVWWRAAADEINWRRFFDVISLAGLRVELPEVFDATHELIVRLYGEGWIDGVRIDHVDGLAAPRAYCRKLRRTLQAAAAARPARAPQGPPYIVVEKILAAHERLPKDWLTDGTTGYDFMDQVGGLLHDPAGEVLLTALWEELTGNADNYATEELEARRLILRDALSSELNATAAALHRTALRDLATRDYTLTAIRRALTELLVHFPVYRQYAGLAGRPRTDERILARAMAGARRTMRAADHPLLEMLGSWLGGQAPRALPPGAQRRERLRAIVRFEQLSSPVAAKSMEDTAFYRYGRLLSRNEVGSNPAQFACTPAAFHAACAERARDYPAAMLATATHDHKRGEDLRARLAVLSEIPEEWGGQLRRWMRLNASHRRDVDGGPAPRPAAEIMLYQMLVAAWPLGLSADDTAGVQSFLERISVWQEKALREAKQHSAWVAPNEAYEQACRDFVFQLADRQRPFKPAEEIANFAMRIAPAGALNSLSQTVLRLTVPGVPDLYQGADLWDFSLVDPDNRRPVDYARRAELLGASASSANWHTGQVKQQVIRQVLAWRAELPALFADGRYIKLRVEGSAAANVVAFGREQAEARALVVVPRVPTKLLADALEPVIPRQAFGDTKITLPRGWAGSSWQNVLGAPSLNTAGTVLVSRLFDGMAVGIWRN